MLPVNMSLFFFSTSLITFSHWFSFLKFSIVIFICLFPLLLNESRAHGFFFTKERRKKIKMRKWEHEKKKTKKEKEENKKRKKQKSWKFSMPGLHVWCLHLDELASSCRYVHSLISRLYISSQICISWYIQDEDFKWFTTNGKITNTCHYPWLDRMSW